MTTMVRLLERDGLVERRPDPNDGRASRIYLSARSRRFRATVASILDDLDQLVANQLGKRRATELAAGLNKLMTLDA